MESSPSSPELPTNTTGLFVEVPADSSVEEEIARRRKKLANIRKAKSNLKARQRERDEAKGRKPGQKRNPKGGPAYKRPFGEPEAKAQSNFTDPESRIMLTSQDGFQQGYNAQTVADGRNQFIVETRVTNQATDQDQLLSMVTATQDTYDQQLAIVIADAGYCSEANITALNARGIDGYIAVGRESGKVVSINPETRPATDRMWDKLRTKEGRAVYRERKWLSEAPNGWTKSVLGFRQFSVRGLKKVAGEWDLVCLSLNLRRLFAMQVANVT